MSRIYEKKNKYTQKNENVIMTMTTNCVFTADNDFKNSLKQSQMSKYDVYKQCQIVRNNVKSEKMMTKRR